MCIGLPNPKYFVNRYLVWAIAFCITFYSPIGFSQSEEKSVPQSIQSLMAHATDEAKRVNTILLNEGSSLNFEKAFNEAAISDSSINERDGLDAIKEVASMDVQRYENISVEAKFKLLSRALFFGHRRKLEGLLNELVNKLYIEGDSKNYRVVVSANVMPNAAILPGRSLMIINAGLIAYAKNIDELAHVIAHEMTHDNPEHLKSLKDGKEVEGLLSQLSDYKDLNPDQREELRADIGSLERMINGGFNPWAGYNFQKRFTTFFGKSPDATVIRKLFKLFSRHTFEFWEAHPIGEIRMAAMKAYIIHQQTTNIDVDLAELVSKYQKFPASLNLLRVRINTFTKPLMSIWLQRAVYGFVGYRIVDMLAMALFSVGVTDTEFVRDAIEKAAIGNSLGRLIADAWSGVSEFSTQLLHAVPQGVWEVTSSSLYAASLGLTVWVASMPFWIAASSVWRKIRTHPNYSKLTFSKSQLKGYAVFLRKLLNSESPSEEMILRVMKLNVNRLRDIETIYKESELMEFFSVLLGLQKIRNQYSHLLVLTLNQVHRLPNQSLTQMTEFNSTLDRLPAFVSENKTVVELLTSLCGVRCRSSGLSVERQPNESLWRYRVRLQNMSKAQSENPLNYLVLASQFYKIGLKDTAFRVFGSNEGRIQEVLFSKDNTQPKLVDDFTFLLNARRNEHTIRRNKPLESSYREGQILVGRARAEVRTTSEKIGVMSAHKSVPIKGPWWMSLRWWVQKRDSVSLVRFFSGKFANLTDFVFFITKDLSAHHIKVSNITYEIASAVSANPQWIRNIDEVELLLNTKELWPTLSTEVVTSGGLERIMVDSARALAKKFPEIWRYEPRSANKHHQVILSKVESFGVDLERFDIKLNWWLKLTEKGVTSTTDNLFMEMYNQADSEKKIELESLALEQGRIWQQDIKGEIARRKILDSFEYHKLSASNDPAERMVLLRTLIEKLQMYLPERGIKFPQILEEISVTIQSSQEESRLIHESKKGKLGGERQEDLTSRVLSELLQEALSWKKKHQWELIKYLRGDIQATPMIENAFRVMGPDRVQQMYELLPPLARTVILDSFMDSPKGLLGKVNVKRGYAFRIINHIMAHAQPREREIGTQILSAFLYALNKTGNKALQSYSLSYLLAIPNESQKSPGETLRLILELFGSTGIKIGQFLVTSQLLPEKENEKLKSLQERAEAPTREEIYDDARKLLKTSELPFSIKQTVGVASLKYVYLAKDQKTMEDVVIKVFKLGAVAHTGMEFRILEKMSEFLTKNYGAQYAILSAVIKASKGAVQKELEMSKEVFKSQEARKFVYVDLNENGINVRAPYEALLGRRFKVS